MLHARLLTRYVRKRNCERADERETGKNKGEGREERVIKGGCAALVRENPPRALLCAVRDVPQVFSFPT